jgi:hypothetical protein
MDPVRLDPESLTPRPFERRLDRLLWMLGFQGYTILLGTPNANANADLG